MNSYLRPRPASLVATAVALVLAQSAAAQTVLGEVTVTARKRAESLQDVPFAVSARTEEALRQAGANNIEDVSRNVAGLSVQNLGPGQSQVGLRGISGGKTDRDLPGVKEQVGVYMDESVISLSLFTPDLALYDLNRVEVLRGGRRARCSVRGRSRERSATSATNPILPMRTAMPKSASVRSTTATRAGISGRC